MSVTHRLNLPVIALAFCTLATHAASGQTSISFRPNGPDYLTPNAPFTLTRVTRIETRLQNGTPIQHEERETLTRDAQGRLFDRVSAVLADPLAPPQVVLMLADPAAKTVTQWRLGQTNAKSLAIPPNVHVELQALGIESSQNPHYAKSSATTATEDLGQQEIAGLAATGTRTTTTLAAGAVGNTEPLHIVHEVWIADQLHITLRELDTSPFTGIRTINTEKATLNAAPDALFHLPPGLAVTPMATPASLVGTPEQLAYTKAMAELKAPETREAAADVVVRYAQAHPEVANHIAHELAVRNTHLADAKTLADQSVARLETTAATLTLGNETSSTYAEMSDLAEYWDSLGSVIAALGDGATAERYFRRAWALGGEGLYLDHIAILQNAVGDKAAALKTDLVALSGKMEAWEVDQITRRAQRLGDAQPQATPEPTIIDVPDVPGARKLDGSADFNLLFSGAGEPAVQWISGADSLKSATSAIAAATFAPQTPDTGPEHVLRRGHLACTTAAGCKLTLLYSWQAEDAVNAPLRKAAPGAAAD